MLNKARIQANLLICLLTPVAYALLHNLSTNLETLNNLVSWYFPTGLLCGLLLFLPRHYWLVALIGSYLGRQIIFYYDTGEPFLGDWIAEYVFSSVTLLFYPIGIFIYKKKYKRFIADQFKPLLFLFLCLSISALITAITQIYIWVRFDYVLGLELLMSVSSFAIGDFIGFLLMLPLFILARSLIVNGKLIHLTLIKKCLMVLVPTLGIYIFFIQLHIDMLYYVKLFAFIPIIWLSFSYGHNGALLATSKTNLAIVATLILGNAQSTIMQDQIYLIVITLTGLLLGATSTEHKRLNNNLSRLSEKLIDIREVEKRKLSSELHDGLGQDITALKTNLEIINRLGLSEQQLKIHHRLTNSANEIHESVYDLLQWLRPKILDDVGLENVIKGTMFDELLSAVNIKYHTVVVGETDDLNDEITTAIFRTCQECVSNCIRHSQAKNLWLSLLVNGEKVTLTITDDGTGLDEQHSSTKDGFGLIGIEERIIALKGHFHFHNTANDATYQIEFPLL